MDHPIIYGIQQIGLGAENADKAMHWYAKHLGFDIQIFEDNNTAIHMAPYMGGRPQAKRALLAMNLKGGGGIEFWQFRDRTPQNANFDIHWGDLGLLSAFVRQSAENIEISFEKLRSSGALILSPILTDPDEVKCFYIKDPFNNIIKIRESDSWFNKKGPRSGGVSGCSIGVSDIEKALPLYRDVLGYDKVVYDKSGNFEDLQYLPGGNKKFRRLMLVPSTQTSGAFSPLLGKSCIELVQCLDRTPRKIYDNRYWGDPGFIHLCFDIRGIDSMKEVCSNKGFPFVVMSPESFEMGETNGRWAYLEDPDGTMIEFIETQRVPVVPSIGLNIDLRKRNPTKDLPRWLIQALRFKVIR